MRNVIRRSDIDKVTVFYVLTIGSVGLVSWALIDPTGVQQISSTRIEDAAEKALEISTDIVKLLLSLSTGVMAGCGWLMTRWSTAGARGVTSGLVLVSASLLLHSSSMYFGFVTLEGSLELLAWNVFDSRANLVWWPQTLQYYSFLAGVIVYGLAVIRSVNVLTKLEGTDEGT